MTIFRVGQRVRIKYTACGISKHVGMEATVTDPVLDDGRVEIEIDDSRSPHPSGLWAAHPEQLEPLTDSYDLVSWESMRDLWVPEHLREVA